MIESRVTSECQMNCLQLVAPFTAVDRQEARTPPLAGAPGCCLSMHELSMDDELFDGMLKEPLRAHTHTHKMRTYVSR